MGKLDAAWSAGDLAKAVCDELVSKGLLKEKPAFNREDREKKLTQVFAAAKLDGASMATMNGGEVGAGESDFSGVQSVRVCGCGARRCEVWLMRLRVRVRVRPDPKP